MDVSLFRSINEGWTSTAADTFFALLSYSGLGVAMAVVLLIVVAVGGERRAPAFAALVSLTLGGLLIAHTLKAAIPRDRPSVMSTTIPREPHLRSSFPSAHTSSAFAVSTALGIALWRRGRRAGVVGLHVWALGVGISRIYRGVHWPSDVVGGMFVGVASGCIAVGACDAYISRRNSRAESNVAESA